MPKPSPDELRRMKEAASGRKARHSEQWGGARPGAGRKRTGARKVVKCFSLSAEAVARLERAAKGGECSMSEIVENLISVNLRYHEDL